MKDEHIWLSVILTFACPNISLKHFTSKPSSIHFVAKVMSSMHENAYFQYYFVALKL